MTQTTLKQIAAEMGLSPATVRRMHAEANTQRAKGETTERTMPAPVATGEGGVLLWDAAQVSVWQAAREKPQRRGAVPKGVLRSAITHLEDGRVDAALAILRKAVA